MADQTKTAKRSKLLLTAMALVFLTPLIAALLLFKFGASVTGKTTNYGHLINPPFSLNDLKMHNQQGQLLQNNAINHGKWLLLLLQNGPCNQLCKKNIYYLRQIHIATGKYRNRVQQAILTFNSVEQKNLSQMLHKKMKDTHVLLTKKQTFHRLFTKDTAFKTQPHSGTMLIADPFENVILAYQPNENRMHVLKDLQRLLKVSQIG